MGQKSCYYKNIRKKNKLKKLLICIKLNLITIENANIDLIFEKQEQMYRLKKKLYSLPIEESCILELYYNGFKFSDIAKLLDIRMEKIKYSMHRIKKKLKVEKKD